MRDKRHKAASEKSVEPFGFVAQAYPEPKTVSLFKNWTRWTTDPFGRCSEVDQQGIFCANTQMVSLHRIRVNGQEVNHRLSTQLTARSWHMAGLLADSGESGNLPRGHLPEGCIDLSHQRLVGEGLTERLIVSNRGAKATRKIRVELEMKVPIADTEFQDEMKKSATKKRNQKGSVTRGRNGITISYLRSFGMRKKTPSDELSRLYRNQTAPNKGDIVRRGMKFSSVVRTRGKVNRTTFRNGDTSRLTVEIVLPAGSSAEIIFTYDFDIDGLIFRAPPITDRTFNELKLDLDSLGPKFSSGLPAVDLVVRQAMRDMRDLEFSEEGAVIAGIPRYVGIFGRDTLIAGWQSAMFGRSCLGRGIAALASVQGRREWNFRDEEVGRLPHELRRDPASAVGQHNRGLYYGDDTATPFFCIALATHYAWEKDLAFVRLHAATLIACCDWITRKLEAGEGLIYYLSRVRPEKEGNRNQAWKDSGDAIVDAWGRVCIAPMALCEIQGYAHQALVVSAHLLDELGDTRRSGTLRAAARKLKKVFNQKFWLDGKDFFALALDAKAKPIATRASNIGHCLDTGIIAHNRVKGVVQFLMSDDMFSGWGIRTLSSRNPGYDPFSYHRGSVWPVENSEIAARMARAGFKTEAATIIKAQLELATLFPHFRLPEVVSGHYRGAEFPVPGLYPQANLLQAWSVSSVLQMIQTLTGFFPDIRVKTAWRKCRLPVWMEQLNLDGVEHAKSRFTFHLTN